MIDARVKPYVIFVGLGLLAYLGLETSAEFAARFVVKSSVGLQDLGESLEAALSLWMFAGTYYALLGLICASLAAKTSFKKALRLFIIGVLALGYLGYMCAHASQEALLKHAWTAAALVYLGLVIYGAVVIFACLIIRFLAGRKAKAIQPGS